MTRNYTHTRDGLSKPHHMLLLFLPISLHASTHVTAIPAYITSCKAQEASERGSFFFMEENTKRHINAENNAKVTTYTGASVSHIGLYLFGKTLVSRFLYGNLVWVRRAFFFWHFVVFARIQYTVSCINIKSFINY